ncbi:PD40 domain-containing protein [Candidatus Poribacteria bacterium]|nr:PD40 domain-containing protein [Candidatus Poribacteria bacterium]
MKPMKRTGIAVLLCICVTLLESVSQAQLTNTKIAFPSDRDGNFEIYVMNPDGTNPTRLTNNATDDRHPAWSPDGTKIAFESNRNGNFEIYVMDADGTNPVNITNHPALDINPSWSPDGTAIAFSSNRDGNLEIYVMNADGTNPIRLTTDPAVDQWPSWSPDGTKIAFWAERDGGVNNREIYVMNADGTNQVNLTNNNSVEDYVPSWSPDGTKIGFASARDGGRLEVYEMNADGTNPKRLTNNTAHDIGPSWSPDGTKIAFYSERDGQAEIYVMNADGTNQVNRTNHGAWDDYAPAWSPFLNRPPVADAGGPYNVDEGGSVEVTASGSDPDGDPITFAWDLDNDGSFEAPGQSVTFSAAGLDGPSTHTIRVQVTDSGGLSAIDQATVTVQNIVPTVGAISAPVDPNQVNTTINTSATFTDPGTPDTHTAVWDWGDSSTSPGTVTETNGSGSVTGSHSYTTAGVYTVTLTVTDDDGGSGGSTFQFIVVYDPNAGFVTGGGWIDSPAGAYAPNPSLTGKANFGFVSKYQKGATVPTGQTQFNFRVANLNFHSNLYEWLVVAGARAQYKGTGTINSAGNYGFMLTTIDGAINGGGGTDKFRIKIWDKNNGDTIVYDNQMGDADDTDPTTVIGGGSIVIHKDSSAAPAATTALPKDTRLAPAFPNPSNPEVWIPYQLSFDSEVVIRIYDVMGHLVRTVDVGHQAAGFYESKAKAAHWDGRNNRGETVASGVYFYTLQAGDFTATRKLQLRR